MKSIIRTLAVVVFLLALTTMLQAQTPPHPNNGSGAPTGFNTPVGAGAPIADGQLLLLAFALAYASRKLYALPIGLKKA